MSGLAGEGSDKEIDRVVEGERVCVGRRPRNWKQSYQDTAVAFSGDVLDPARWVRGDKLNRTLQHLHQAFNCSSYSFRPHPATCLPRTSPPA